MEFSVEEFMTWIIFLEQKRKDEQHQLNVAKMRSRARRQMAKLVKIDIVARDKTKRAIASSKK